MNRTIHYIWLGRKKKPAYVRKCIASWAKYMPGWDIKEWNETNLNIDYCEFSRKAFDEKQYAFVSDVFRFYILYREGGLYFDTDVKLLKSVEPLTLKYQAFVGFEFKILNPGLVLFSHDKHNPIIGEMLELYKQLGFDQENKKVVGAYFSEILEKYGFVYENKFQACESFTVLPSTYFCPTDAYGNPICFSENTYSIHLYAGSWLPFNIRLKKGIKRIFYQLFGLQAMSKMMRVIKKR